MPTFTLATADEIAGLPKKGQSAVKADLAAYAAALSQLGTMPNGDEPGYSVWAKMSADGAKDNRRTEMRRTTQAATAAGVHVQIVKHAADAKVFWVRLRPAPVKRIKASTNGAVTHPPPAPAPATGGKAK